MISSRKHEILKWVENDETGCLLIRSWSWRNASEEKFNKKEKARNWIKHAKFSVPRHSGNLAFIDYRAWQWGCFLERHPWIEDYVPINSEENEVSFSLFLNKEKYILLNPLNSVLEIEITCNEF